VQLFCASSGNKTLRVPDAGYTRGMKLLPLEETGKASRDCRPVDSVITACATFLAGFSVGLAPQAGASTWTHRACLAHRLAVSL